jgi:hypothetical protein
MDGACLIDEGFIVLRTVNKLNKVGQISKQVGRLKNNVQGVKKTTGTKVVKSIIVHNAQRTSMVCQPNKK